MAKDYNTATIDDLLVEGILFFAKGIHNLLVKQACSNCNYTSTFQYTVKPVLRGHPWDNDKVAF